MKNSRHGWSQSFSDPHGVHGVREEQSGLYGSKTFWTDLFQSLYYTSAQAQHAGSLSTQANISMADAVAGASNAKHWMQMQNAGRTSGDKNMLSCSHFYLKSLLSWSFFTVFKIFQDQDAAGRSALQPATKTGRRMGTRATCGTVRRRTGRTLRTFARRKEDIWPLSTQMQPSTSSWREWLDSASILPGWEATTLRLRAPGSGQTALPGISHSGHRHNHRVMGTA